MTAAISIENLGKRYLVDHEAQRSGYRTLRESLVDLACAPLRRFRGQRTSTREEFWALKDVSFEVQPGEVVGIIGRNGAGKSTLLKILSQITKPTTGRVRLNGRVGSLLEVGTGFHPELTGRENIYLNGSILGMTRREIKRKFDEIVDFAEVEKFLDTPVKRYSSGMYVRLAFAVAAHLDPEILIIDEVLAVGDAAFQAKCIAKLSTLTETNTTVLIVSHNIATLRSLCSNAALLNEGKLHAAGNTASVIAKYAELGGTMGAIFHVVTPHLRWHGILNQDDLQDLSAGSDVSLCIDLETGSQPLEDITIDTAIVNARGEWAIHTKSIMVSVPYSFPASQRFTVAFNIRAPQLAPGEYTLRIYIARGSDALLWAEQIPAFTIGSRAHFGRNALLPETKGVTVPPFSIKLDKLCEVP